MELSCWVKHRVCEVMMVPLGGTYPSSCLCLRAGDTARSRVRVQGKDRSSERRCEAVSQPAKEQVKQNSNGDRCRSPSPGSFRMSAARLLLCCCRSCSRCRGSIAGMTCRRTSSPGGNPASRREMDVHVHHAKRSDSGSTSPVDTPAGQGQWC